MQLPKAQCVVAEGKSDVNKNHETIGAQTCGQV